MLGRVGPSRPGNSCPMSSGTRRWRRSTARLRSYDAEAPRAVMAQAGARRARSCRRRPARSPRCRCGRVARRLSRSTISAVRWNGSAIGAPPSIGSAARSSPCRRSASASPRGARRLSRAARLDGRGGRSGRAPDGDGGSCRLLSVGGLATGNVCRQAALVRSNSVAIQWAGLGPELLLRLDRAAARAAARPARARAARGDPLGPPGGGERLPSSREMAAELGVSRGLVLECYTQLQAEGYLTAAAGPPRAWRRPRPEPPPPVDAAARERRFAVDFRPGTPDLTSFPRRDWAWAMREVLRDVARRRVRLRRSARQPTTARGPGRLPAPRPRRRRRPGADRRSAAASPRASTWCIRRARRGTGCARSRSRTRAYAEQRDAARLARPRVAPVRGRRATASTSTRWRRRAPAPSS